MRDFYSAAEYAVKLLFLCESPCSGQLLVQGCSGGENFAAFAAAARNNGPTGFAAIADTEAVLVLALAVAYSNFYFHIYVRFF